MPKATPVSRRRFLTASGLATVPLIAVVNTPPLAQAAAGQQRKLKVICVGAHPDDPESGCAGTLSRYAEMGHTVVVIYFTRGERGIRDKGLDESARIRTAEAEKACALIGGRPVFFGQIDGATELNRVQVDAMTKLLNSEAPDIVFTHWPIDTHMDHQVASITVIRGCMNLANPPQLYFFEVDTGDQSQGFFPDTYVDIAQVLEKKKSALLTHVSQRGDEIWRQHHEVIAAWRGREAGVKAAEAFVHLSRDTARTLLPGI